MVEQFDEINDFFNREEFTQDELIELKNLVKEKYDDKKVYSLAKALIDLELIRFELKNNGDNKIDVMKFKNLTHTKSIKKELVKKIPNRVVKKEDTTIMTVEDVLIYLKGRNLSCIINEISDTNSKEYFLNTLRLKGYYKGRLGKILTEDEFLSIEGELKTAISNICITQTKLIVKTGKKNKNNRSLSKSSSVYDKINNFKGSIKLINIRSK